MKVGTNRKPICDFLLVINSNWYPILYRFGIIAAYYVNFDTAFLSYLTPFGGLGATYYDHLRLIGNRIIDLLLMLIELFSLVVTGEAVRANIGSKSAISL